MLKAFVAATILLAGAPLAAQQTATATAADPDGLLTLLKGAGYTASLGEDDFGDPLISLELAGYGAEILFYGCDENSHDRCDAIQFMSAFDTNGSLEAGKIVAIARNYRYSQAFLDDENDLELRWDVITGEGIPAGVFLKTVRAFTDAIENAADAAFPDK